MEYNTMGWLPPLGSPRGWVGPPREEEEGGVVRLLRGARGKEETEWQEGNEGGPKVDLYVFQMGWGGLNKKIKNKKRTWVGFNR